MVPTLSQVCSLNSLFHQDIEDYAAGQCRSVEIWLTKLEQYVQARSVEAARDLLERNEVAAPVASFQGGLLTSQGAARQESWTLFTRRLDLCRRMNIETLVLANDIQPPFGGQELERTRLSLRQAAEEAERQGRRIAFEFQGRSAFGNNLQTAVALIEEVHSPYLGICLDVFHFSIGPSKLTDLMLLNRENLFHVQLCDLADVPRELATDADRILPGDGDLPLDAVIDCLRSMGYAGCVSIELMNPQLWQVPARQFGEIAMTALRKVLGQAKMA
jgi:4-hydroxyphenylpyruvate dioxygenase